MVVYEPESPPDTSNPELTEYLARELRRITEALFGVEEIRLPEINVAVDKPREGMIVLADGTNWEPVATQGQGFYGYYNAAWHKLG